MPKRSTSIPNELGKDSPDERPRQPSDSRFPGQLTIDIQLIEGFPLYGNESAGDPKMLRWFACWAGAN